MLLALTTLLVPAFLAGQPCAELIEDQLVAWKASPEVLRAPGGPEGGAVYRIATSRIGVWLTYHQPRGTHHQSLFRTDSKETVRLDYLDGCRVARSESRNPAPAPDAFTDEMLRMALNESPRLVVYLWSPHSPLSVDGYHEIAAAAADLEVRFIAISDASADPSYRDATADASGIPKLARRPLGSTELLFRDLAVHTPAILVFAWGEASAPLPGFRLRDAYREYLRSIFERSGR